MQFIAQDIIANGIRLRTYRTPAAETKPPVVLCHGFSDNALCWTALARELAPDYGVYMADARCHGDSEAPTGDNGPEAKAADLNAFIEVMGLDRPVVAGHSMGASQVFLALVRYPGLMRAAILEDPVWWLNPPSGTRPDRSGLFAHLASTSFEDLLAENASEHPSWDRETLELFTRAKQQLHPRIMNGAALQQGDLLEMIDQVTCPTLFYTGDPSLGSIVSNETAEAVLARSPLMSREHVAGVGHHIRYENAAQYTAAFKAYLAHVDWS